MTDTRPIPTEPTPQPPAERFQPDSAYPDAPLPGFVKMTDDKAAIDAIAAATAQHNERPPGEGEVVA
jgi:hypothetical protein